MLQRKFSATAYVIEKIVHEGLVEATSSWLDHLSDEASEATDKRMEDQGWCEVDTKHPIEELIDAVYHDLLSASYFQKASEADDWEDKARKLGFTTKWEFKLQEERFNAERLAKEANEP